MSEPTLRTYPNALHRIFVVDEVPAWVPALRSETPLRTSGVWHLCDSSLAAAALDAGEGALLDDLATMGFLFESLCIRDLRAYLASAGGKVFLQSAMARLMRSFSASSDSCGFRCKTPYGEEDIAAVLRQRTAWGAARSRFPCAWANVNSRRPTFSKTSSITSCGEGGSAWTSGSCRCNAGESSSPERVTYEVDFICNRGSQRYYVQSAFA